jgi:hypothetical protein
MSHDGDGRDVADHHRQSLGNAWILAFNKVARRTVSLNNPRLLREDGQLRHASPERGGDATIVDKMQRSESG